MRRRFFQNANNLSYMFIEALENDFSLNITHTGKLQYCIDNGEYSDVNISISGVNKGSRIYFVGYLAFSNIANQFTITKKCKIGGDIRSIIYGNDFRKYNNIIDRRLRGLFRESTGIIEVENGFLKGLTELSQLCYYGMFQGCTSLQTAPELPATTLDYNCYSYMFQGCTNLNYIKMLATDISAGNCLDNWVNGVASSGTFVKNSAMNDLPTGVSGIPSGWTVENA